MQLKFFLINKKKISFEFFDNEALKKVHKRVFFATSVFIIVYMFILVRLTDVMVISQFSIKENLNVSIDDVDLKRRGDIYDRNGEILATSIRSFSLSARPKLILNKSKVAIKLSKIIDMDSKKILKKISKNSPFVYIKRDLSPSEHFKINNLGEIGLEITKEQRRVYPHGSVTSHVVGYTNIDEEGLGGIERGLNSKLKNGENIYLSIDLRLQNLVTNELEKTIKNFDAKGGLSIILDIESGEVIASSSLPNFDPNNIDSSLKENFFNSVTQGVYEMGSTFKPITMAIGFDSNKINENSKFPVGKPLKLGKKLLHDHSPQKGSLNIREIIVHSSNIGAAQVAEKIGKKSLKNYLNKFKLFQKQLIELPEIGTPLLPIYWSKISTMTIGYGYGISITPLQLCSAYATLVNGGLQLSPSYLKNLHNGENKESPRIISESTSVKIRELLRAVVLETKFTGPSVRAMGYEIGGKTGTTEIVTNEGYHKKANLSSFIGVFPMSKPKYVVYVMIREAKGTDETYFHTTGGWIAAPTVGRIIKKMINLLGVLPIENDEVFKVEVNSLKKVNFNAVY